MAGFVHDKQKRRCRIKTNGGANERETDLFKPTLSATFFIKRQQEANLKQTNDMIQEFCKWLLYKHLGWKKNVTVDHPDKYIICMAPHTSNTDFLIGQLYMRAEGLKINFLMKKEWFFWPLGILFRRIGGIPIQRSRHSRMTDRLAEIAKSEKQFKLCITPEGTRSLNGEWKRGFYFIALNAGIPVLLYGLDYERKLIQCTRSIMPDGNADSEMKDIKSYFKGFKGKHPELFTTGD